MSSKREKLLESAQKHIRKNAWDKAVKDYQLVLEEDPGDVRTRLKVADLLVKIERFDEALADYQTVAYHYAKDDIYDKAVAVYKQALRIAPEDPRLHRDLGEAYWRHGRLKDALRAFHMAQKHFREAGDAVSQRDVLERMVSIDPDDVGLQVQLAERYEKDGLRVESLQIFRRAAAHLRQEGRLDEFVQVGERVVFLEPSDVPLRKEIIHIYLDRDDNKHALKHLQILFKDHPQDGEVLSCLGLCFSRLGEKDKAMLVYLELAKAQRRGGDESAALETYRKILAIDPGHPEARAALGQKEQKAAPVASPAPKAAPAKDVLSGVEFLDDESEPEVDANPTNEGAETDDFMGLEDEFNDFDSEVLSKFDENPATALSKRVPPTASTPEPAPVEVQELSDIEIVPVAKKSPVTQLLTESEVFLKYRLFDRAEEVIGRAAAMEPENLEVREKLHELRVGMGDRMRAAFELFEMARLTARDRSQAMQYLVRAREFADEPTVQRYAERYGVALPSTNVAALSPHAIDEISEGIEEISETFGDAQIGGNSPIVEFLPPDDDEVDLSGQSAVEDSGEVIYDMDDLGMDDLELDEFEEDEIDLGDAEELELEDVDVKFDARELALLVEVEESESFEMDFSGDDAEKIFEELFGDAPAPAPASATAAAPQRMASSVRLPDIDYMIDAGDLTAAEEALEALADSAPGNPGIMARQARIREMRGKGNNHAFGARSLSGKFAKEYSTVLATSIPDVNNTNLELGLTYVDMGLFEDALDEFQQALDDPHARNDAMFYMAVCDAELKNLESAFQRLRHLLTDTSVPGRIQQAAQAKLDQIRST